MPSGQGPSLAVSRLRLTLISGTAPGNVWVVAAPLPRPRVAPTSGALLSQAGHWQHTQEIRCCLQPWEPGFVSPQQTCPSGRSPSDRKTEEPVWSHGSPYLCLYRQETTHLYVRVHLCRGVWQGPPERRGVAVNQAPWPPPDGLPAGRVRVEPAPSATESVALHQRAAGRPVRSGGAPWRRCPFMYLLISFDKC